MSDETILTGETPAPPGGGGEAVDQNAEGQEPAPADSATDEPEQKADEGAAGDEKEKPEGAPESYDDFSMPEGIEIDHAALEQATTLFKEMNLSQEQAQKVVDLYAGLQQEQEQKVQEFWQNQKAEWIQQAKADKEIGGDKFVENVAIAKKALERFGTPKLVEELNRYGTGDNPELIRFMYRIGKQISQDGYVPGSGGAGSGGERMLSYSSMEQQQ